MGFISIFIPSNLSVLPIGLWKQADGFIKVYIFFNSFLKFDHLGVQFCFFFYMFCCDLDHWNHGFCW